MRIENVRRYSSLNDYTDVCAYMYVRNSTLQSRIVTFVLCTVSTEYLLTQIYF